MGASSARSARAGSRQSARRANRAHTGRRKVLVRLERDRCAFSQVVEPHIAHVVASKRVALAVLAEQRAVVAPELRDAAGHTSCPTCFRRCRKVCTRAAMSAALTGSLLIDWALSRRLSSARVI